MFNGLTILTYQQNPLFMVWSISKGKLKYFWYFSFGHQVMFPTCPVISRSIFKQTVKAGYSNGVSITTYRDVVILLRA